jgi:hypothetical protein
MLLAGFVAPTLALALSDPAAAADVNDLGGRCVGAEVVEPAGQPVTVEFRRCIPFPAGEA